VHLKNGKTLDGRVDEPKGDPGNTLSRQEIQEKALRPQSYRVISPCSIGVILPCTYCGV
jgi:2-methylcitrate dehydratase PrpD